MAKENLDSYRKEIDIGLKFHIDNEEKDKLKKAVEEDTKFSLGDTLKKSAKSFFEDSGKKFINFAKKEFLDLFKQAWNELGEVLNYSLLSDSNIRETKFKYGFSSAEVYGFDKAREALEISSEEDLMYMNSTQQQYFRDIMTKQAENYQKLYDSGFFDELLSFKLEWSEFKQDVLVDVMEVIMSNKDTIKTFLELGVKGMGAILDITGWLMNTFGLSTSYATSNTGNSYKTINVKMDNTYNNVSKENQTWIQNSGDMTYHQLIKSLRES